MTIIYSGFDTIVFAVQGALSPEAIERMEHVKDQAEKERRDIPFHMLGITEPTLIGPNGRKGGYAFVLSTGPLGQLITFKKNISRTMWNGHVKIRALSLATLGWQRALDQALNTLTECQFHVSGISLHRVDYCMDFLNTPMSLDPRDFVAHSRVKKMSRYAHPTYEKPSVSTCKARESDEVAIRTMMRGEEFESITIGKMPGRQITIYDKRREALDKRNFAWFKIWGTDRYDASQKIHRIELRAGKNELSTYGIRTFEDFTTCIGDVFVKAAQSVRMIDSGSPDTNISRKPVHPTWQHVQTHVKERLFDHTANVTPDQILTVIREEKAREYMSQIRGNIAGFAVCKNIGFKHISECLPEIIFNELEVAANNPNGQFQKTYVRAHDRLQFIDSP